MTAFFLPELFEFMLTKQEAVIVDFFVGHGMDATNYRMHGANFSESKFNYCVYEVAVKAL